MRKEGIEISLELGANCPKAISKGKPIANLLCVKGANGAGKTNALKILGFLKFFCCHSFAVKPDDDIAVDSFFYNDDPIEIYCDFIFDTTQYRYELSLTKEHVIYEKLSRKIKRSTTVFERKNMKLTSYINEYSDLQQVKIRSNASILSTAYQFQAESIQPVYDFFEAVLVNVNWIGRTNVYADYRKISKYYKDNKDVLRAAIKIIKECDLGISDVKIHKIEEENGNSPFYPVFQHDVDAKNNKLSFHSQSLGTQTLFRSIPLYVSALQNGGILVMDEFDIDFHPHMLSKIVQYFDNEDINTKNAQMIFSTHNTDIIDYMGKYRTVLVNKDYSESYGYRLDEIPGDIIRNNRPIAPVYNSGKIGGVPRI